MGLTSFIMNGAFSRIKHLEEWKATRPRNEEMVTFKEHSTLCRIACDDMKTFIKEKIGEIKDEIVELKKEVKKSNGG